MKKEKSKKEKKAEAEPVKSLTSDERKQILVEGIKKTVVPAFIAVIFAIVLFLRFGDAFGLPWFSVLLLVVLISYYIQKLIYPFLGVRVGEFEKKDWFYVEFMVIIFLMVVWTFLLNQ